MGGWGAGGGGGGGVVIIRLDLGADGGNCQPDVLLW